MRAHCRKLASLVEHHESRAASAENTLSLLQQRKKAAARRSEEYVEYVRVPRRGNISYNTAVISCCSSLQYFKSISLLWC